MILRRDFFVGFSFTRFTAFLALFGFVEPSLGTEKIEGSGSGTNSSWSSTKMLMLLRRGDSSGVSASSVSSEMNSANVDDAYRFDD